jgi:hypothetical protein
MEDGMGVEARPVTHIISETQRLEHIVAAAEEVECRIQSEINRISGSIPVQAEKNIKEPNKPSCDLERLSMAITRMGTIIERMGHQSDRVRSI